MKKEGTDGTFEYYCDVQGCRKRIFPLDLHVRIPKSTLRGGGQGDLLYFCRQCATRIFQLRPRAWDD